MSNIQACDRCQLPAAVTASHPVKDELLLTFCGHHGRKAYEGLVAEGWTIIVDPEREIFFPGVDPIKKPVAA